LEEHKKKLEQFIEKESIDEDLKELLNRECKQVDAIINPAPAETVAETKAAASEAISEKNTA